LYRRLASALGSLRVIRLTIPRLPSGASRFSFRAEKSSSRCEYCLIQWTTSFMALWKCVVVTERSEDGVARIKELFDKSPTTLPVGCRAIMLYPGGCRCTLRVPTGAIRNTGGFPVCCYSP